jgi:serine/threonine protein phosphatase 1
LSKYIVIGDIHGCGKTLAKLIEQLKPYTDRKLIFIGDYIDRGANSALALDVAMKASERWECIYLRGNHEQMMLDAFINKAPTMWTFNGGMQTMISLKIQSVNDGIPEPYFSFFLQTLMYYDTDEYFFVHGGLPAEKKISEMLQNEEDIGSMLWERSHLNSDFQVWEKKVVFGHTPFVEPLITDKMIGIDTGCVFRSHEGLGNLTAILLPENKIIQIKNCEFQ